MDIERWDGTKERRYYDSPADMIADAEQEAKDPNTKTLVLHFPKMRIPGRKRAAKSPKDEEK